MVPTPLEGVPLGEAVDPLESEPVGVLEGVRVPVALPDRDTDGAEEAEALGVLEVAGVPLATPVPMGESVPSKDTVGTPTEEVGEGCMVVERAPVGDMVTVPVGVGAGPVGVPVPPLDALAAPLAAPLPVG